MLDQNKDHQNWLRCDADTGLEVNPATAFPHEHVRSKQIGEGAEGTVETWRHKPSDLVIAVKVNHGLTSPGKLPVEVDILKSLPAHHAIINCFAYLPRQETLGGDCIFYEYCPGGDMFDFMVDMLETNKMIFSGAFLWNVYAQLASAMAFLHEGVGCADTTVEHSWRPVAHRDIKPENIFIASRGSKDDFSDMTFKLGDFGLSAFYDPDNARVPGTWGTTMYWPPEQTWEERRGLPEGDIWAIGSIIHRLCHGYLPMQDPEVFERLSMRDQKIRKPPFHLLEVFWACKAPRKPIPINLSSDQQEEYKDERRWRPTPRYSDALNECMMMALKLQMKERATGAELKRHVDQAHAAFMFEELSLDDGALRGERDVQGSTECLQP